MKIDLASQVKRAKPNLKEVKAPLSNVTKAEVTDLARLYLDVLKVWSIGSKDLLIPEYMSSLTRMTQDDSRDIEGLVNSIDNRTTQAVLRFTTEFSRWAARFQSRHLKKLINSLKYVTGIDLTTQLGSGDTASTVEDLLARNTALVRNVSDQARGRISDILYRNLQVRTPPRQVAREINQALGLGRDRSLRIAQDQATKFAAALDQERQEQLGMDSFEWVHSQKKRPRLEHVARNGKTYSWKSEVARTDPPGYAPFCGCKARGLLRIP